MAWLLDNNVLSELRRPKPEPKVIAFIAEQPVEHSMSAPSRWPKFDSASNFVSEPDRRAELNDWLTHKVRPMFDQRVLPVTEEIMFKWRLLVEAGRKTGHTFSQPDLIIAATALHHGLTIVTRDRRDYDRARVMVLDPWEA